MPTKINRNLGNIPEKHLVVPWDFSGKSPDSRNSGSLSCDLPAQCSHAEIIPPISKNGVQTVWKPIRCLYAVPMVSLTPDVCAFAAFLREIRRLENPPGSPVIPPPICQNSHKSILSSFDSQQKRFYIFPVRQTMRSRSIDCTKRHRGSLFSRSR